MLTRPGRLLRGSGFLTLVLLLSAAAAQAQTTVVSRSPARNATAAPRNAAVSVGFSQAISAASAPNLRVFGNQRRGRRAGTLSGGGTTQLGLAPTQPFAPGEVISVSLPPTLTSTAGGALTRQVYQFTAAAGGTGRGFFPDTAVVGNTGSRDQALGDLDNDGDLDLITTGALYGCRIFINDGAGRFSFKTGVTAAETPSGVALTDVDQDGDLDMLVSDSENNSVAVCLNDGTGEFIGSVTGAQNAPVGARPVGVAAGDVDGDGDLDFVTANEEGNSSTVFLNGGPYTAIGLHYYAPSTVAVGSGPSAVVLADIDNDGDLDLLTSNAGTYANPLDEVHVSRNNGLGTFAAYSTVSVGAQPSELAVADVDGDGDLDLLTANAGAASVSVRLNNGGGGFAGSAALALPAGSQLTGLRAGDVDADGDLDLVVAQGVGGRVITFINTGGTFAAQARPLRLAASSPGETSAAVGVVLGDVDGDLDLDVITSNPSGQVILGFNQSSAPPLPAATVTGFTPSAGPVGTTVTISGTALAGTTAVRFNGTAAPGFVVNAAGSAITVAVPAGASSGPVSVLTEEAGTATSAGAFTVTVPVPVVVTGVAPGRNASAVPRNSSVAATFSVPITAATASQLRVFGAQLRGRRPGPVSGGGTATLTFDPDQDFAPGEQVSVTLPAGLLAADGNQVARQVYQFRAAAGGSGQLNFALETTLAVARAGALALGDIDNDGDLDVLTPTNVGFSIGRNDGAGAFASVAGPAAPESYQYSLGLGDVEADGDLDVVLISGGGTVTTWLNNGSGTFASGSSGSVGGEARQVAFGDMDADGDLDLLAVTGSGVQLQLNDGGGRFSGALVINGKFGASGLAVGDVDGDGDLDLALSSFANYSDDGAVSLRLNDGAGRFTAGQDLAVGAAPTRLALGDVDGDGDLDLAVNGSRARTLLNNGAGLYGPAAVLPVFGSGLVLGDADGDGDLDVVTHNIVGLNDGAGAITSGQRVGGGDYPSDIAVGDVDGDGDLDVLTSYSDRVSVRLNRPAPAPTLTSLTPGSGPVGSTVLLTGTNFIGARSVAFQGATALRYTVLSATELVVTVPDGASSGPITVTTPAGAATSAASFAVTLPLAVVRVSPTRDAASAPRATTVSVTFAQPISAATADNLRVFGARQHGRRPGTVTGGGTATLTFAPDQAFAPGEAVSVSLPATLAGASGGHVRPQAFQFTAAASGTGTGLFMGTQDVPTRYTSFALAAGDLDNDGDQDLVTGAGQIHLGNGDGSFTDAPEPALISRDAINLVLADLNADGRLDLVSSRGDVQLNAGAGTFTALPKLPRLDYFINQVAVGDLDGDGDLDVAASLNQQDSVVVFFNDGSGLFPRSRRVAVSTRPAGLAVGDVDYDGDLDLVVACEGVSTQNSRLDICLNNGDGLFSNARQLPAGSGLGRVVLGDLDGDGDLDLATDNGLVRVNDGVGNFTGTQTTSTGGSLALGDIDADGDLDLVIGGQALATHRNDGTGRFSRNAADDLTFEGYLGGYNNGTTLTDVDGDGDLDLLAPSSIRYVIRLRLNQRIAPPVLTSFTPGSGLVGATVVLTGTDLIGTSGVAFNGTAAPDFVVNSVSQLTVRVPAGATTGAITVTNPKGTARADAPFTVLLPVPVRSVSPVPNAVAPRTAAVAVTFSEAIATNTAANLAVFSQQRGGQLAGRRGGAGSPTLTFAPSQPFAPGEQISVSIPAYTAANRTRVLKQVYQFRAGVGGTGRGFFEAPAAFPLRESTGPVGVLGDVDNDGDADLVTGLHASAVVQRNNGAASFVADNTVAVAPNASLALGDLDGDGDLDLAAASWSGNVVSIRLNDGTGSFSGTLEVAVGDGPRSMMLADMDGDGDLDLVTTNDGRTSSTDGTTSVRFNDGAAHFAGTHDDFIMKLSLGLWSNTQIGDVDGDGDLDLLVCIGNQLHVRLNDGLGGLTAAAAAPIALPRGSGGTLYLGDVDADGDLDVLALNSSSLGGEVSPLNVCRNDGTGRFTRTEFPTIANVGQMAVGDVDADGDADVLIMGTWDHPGQLWLNNGRGDFTYLLDLPLSRQSGWALFGDLDQDGDLDLITSYYYANPTTFNVQLNGPTPPPVLSAFSPDKGPEGTTTVVLTGSGLLGTTAVQFNGLNAPGFVVNSPTQLTVKVPIGARTGLITVTTPVATATSGQPFTVLPLVGFTGRTPGRNAVAAGRSAPVQLTFSAAVTAASAGNLRVFGNQLRGRRPGVVSGGGTASLSFDPDQDFAPGEQISVSLPYSLQTADGGLVRRQVYQFTAATGGSGRGRFGGGANLVPGWYAADLTVGDIDNDGDLDLLTPVEVQYTGANSIAVQLNDGRGNFRPGPGIDPGSYSTPSRLVLGDVDGDGDLDVVAGYGGAAVSVCLNNGAGTFAAARQLYNLPSGNLALGDMDADGDLDLVGVAYQAGALRVALNDGSGTFAPLAPGPPAPSARAVVLGDADNDGDLDVLTANDTQGLRLYLNDGAGELTASLVLLVPPGAVHDVALHDLDADGGLDLVAGGNDPNGTAWVMSWRNPGGAGSFVPAGRLTTGGRYLNRLRLGDVDHDGDLDILTANGSSDDVSVCFNDGQGTFASSLSVPVSSNPGTLALGDLDGDGDLDLAALQSATGGAWLNLRFNESQGLAAAPARLPAPGVALYPNPAHGQVTLTIPAGLRPALAADEPLRIYNSLGQLVLEQALRLDSRGQMQVEVAQLPPGLYTLQLVAGGSLITRPLQLN